MPKITTAKRILSSAESTALLKILKARFEENMQRHKGLVWKKIEAKLSVQSEKLWSLHEMERSGGEPDVVGCDKKKNEYVFFDCSAESPKGRRSLCYDKAAWISRKTFKPDGNVLDTAATMGIELLTEDQYQVLQHLGSFDAKTSSWIQTPANIRKLGGAIYADRRYNHVFIYHNGAESYYSARGFRGALLV